MKTLSAKEKHDLLNSKGIANIAPHNMSGKCFHWPYCTRCGLVALRNRVTTKALRKKCVVYE